MSAFLLFGLNFMMTSADATLGCKITQEVEIICALLLMLANGTSRIAAHYLDDISIHDDQFVWL